MIIGTLSMQNIQFESYKSVTIILAKPPISHSLSTNKQKAKVYFCKLVDGTN